MWDDFFGIYESDNICFIDHDSFELQNSQQVGTWMPLPRGWINVDDDDADGADDTDDADDPNDAVCTVQQEDDSAHAQDDRAHFQGKEPQQTPRINKCRNLNQNALSDSNKLATNKDDHCEIGGHWTANRPPEPSVQSCYRISAGTDTALALQPWHYHPIIGNLTLNALYWLLSFDKQAKATPLWKWVKHPDLALQLWIKLANHRPKRTLLNLPVSNYKFLPNVGESNYFDAQMIEVTNTAIQDKEPEVYQDNVPEKQDKLTADQKSMITERMITASKPNTRLDTRILRAKERDREEKRHKEADLPDPRIPEAGLNPYNQPGNKIPSSGLNRITGKQELNTTRATWITKSGITILPLGGEEQGIYFGSEALPTGLLNELQIQNQEYRIKEYKLVHYDQRNNVLATFDNWVRTIHQAIPFNWRKGLHR